jgi:hypothetical protein
MLSAREGLMRATLRSSLALTFVVAATTSAVPQKIEPARLAQDLVQSRASASTDGQSPSEPGTRTLPRIRELRIRRIAFEPPKLEHLESSRSRSREAIEFVVETDGAVPARAYGPALFVGDVEVDQSERVDETTWRLLAFEPERLKPGAPISWGWMKDPESARRPTPFRYEVQADTGR